MRPKVISTALALTLLVFAAMLTFRRSAEHSVRNTENPATAVATVQPNELALVSQASEQAVSSRTDAGTVGEPETRTAEQHKSYVEQRSSQLMDMAMTDERASLDIILSELANRDPEIRKAALEATIQFGSRDAIPKLSEVVSQTDDPNEKAAIIDAIEFLKLPSLTEITSRATKPAEQPVAKSSRKGAWGKRDIAIPRQSQ